MHAYTYSGHPTCCAVGLKNIEIMEKEGLVKHAGEMGARLLTGLKTLEEFAAVGDVRGLGLMAAVELVSDRSTKAPTPGPENRPARAGRVHQTWLCTAFAATLLCCVRRW